MAKEIYGENLPLQQEIKRMQSENAIVGAWAKTIGCMRQTLEEREIFIKSLISDVAELQSSNDALEKANEQLEGMVRKLMGTVDKLDALVRLLTTERGKNHE